MESSNGTDARSREELEKIQSNHDEAFLYVSQGLAYQEKREYELAQDMYNKGIEKINTALNVRCDRPHCIGPNWDKARKMQQKMRKALQMIKGQLENSSEASILYPDVAPPSYDEACGTSFVGERRSSLQNGASKPSQLVNGTKAEQNLHSLLSDFNSSANGMTDDIVSEVVDIFSIPAGVQLFYISGPSSVSTSSSTSSLHIYKFVDHYPHETEQAVKTLPSGWLQVGNWTYPLVPGQSPSLESGFGAFLFPDVSSDQEGAAVAVILPSSVDSETRQRFKNVLEEFTVLREENVAVPDTAVQDPESFSDTLSRGIVTGAEYLSAGLCKGASVTGEYIHKGASKLRERLHPENRPVPIDPNLQQGLRIAKGASTVALKVTGFLAGKLGDLTMALGTKLAPHIREQGARFLTTAFDKNPQEARQTMDNMLKVAAGGFQGISTIYLGLQDSAKMLAYSLSTETVNIVNYKYGSEAGEAVNDAVTAVGNLALTTHNVQAFGVKSIAKRTAKDAGKAVLKDYSEKVEKPDLTK